jgi:hypothetical protein
MLITGAILSSYQSLKDKTLKLVFETNEPTPEQIVEVARLSQSFGFLAFKKDDFKQDEKETLEGLESDYEDKGKSKSQRLRGVMYRSFERKNEGFNTFSEYYASKMETLINHFKAKLD